MIIFLVEWNDSHLARDLLHLVLGLLDLTSDPRHLGQQPPVVGLRLLPELEDVVIHHRYLQTYYW